MMRWANLWRSSVIFLVLSLGFGLSWAAAAEPAAEAGKGSPEGTRPAESNSAYNDYARFIAGLSEPGSSLAAQEGKPAWTRYARFISQTWETFEKRQLAPMGEWAARELAGATTPAVFYPFSGPDVVNVCALFPQARTYLLIALEPVGEIPDFSVNHAGKFFPSLERSLYDLLHLDFFITEKMGNHLGNHELEGVLPILLFFLARDKARVLEVNYWVMKPDGAIEETPALDRKNHGQGLTGVRLVFSRPGSAESQTLYYFRFNLRNEFLERNPQFVSFLKGFGPLTTFAKAASYLMFKPNYAAIRQFILERSDYVLQDDSAIPVKCFAPAAWNLKLYGTYKGPIDLFSNRRQADLAAAYAKGKEGGDVQPLPFGIGYRHRLHTSNLIFASRKEKVTEGAAK